HREVVECRDQVVDQRPGDGDVHRGREDVVGRLRRVDVVVRVHRTAEAARGERREHLVHVHVRGGPGPGLVDVDREVAVVRAGDDLVRGGRDGLGDVRVE